MAAGSISIPVRACTGCLIEKPLTKEYFPAGAESRGGFKSQCRACKAARGRLRYVESPELRKRRSDSTRAYRAENKDRLKLAAKAWAKNNRDKVAEKQRRYTKANIDLVKKNRSEHFKRNVEKFRDRLRDYRSRNPDKFREYAARAYKRRRLLAEVRLNDSFRSRIRQCLLGQKRGRSWTGLVGYSVEDLKRHLEKQFTKGMSWKNYGIWHVDHVVPLVLFSFDSFDDQEFRAAWALSNLRPLWGEENQAKAGRRTLLL